jgi:carbon storage regulator
VLVTSRRVGESIHIDADIEVVVLDISPTKVRLGIKAPNEVRVTRSELLFQIQEENTSASRPPAQVEAALSTAGRISGKFFVANSNLGKSHR